jgi:hypothetical protein
MKKNYCLALMILLIASIELTASAIGDEPAVLSGHKPTYTPSSNYNSPIPIRVSSSYGPQPVQLSTSSNTQINASSPIAASPFEQVQEGFRIVGDSNESIPNAQFVGRDGSGNSFQEFTDGYGNVVINGSPGYWQFTVYAPRYFSKSMDRQFEYDTYEILMLQKIGVQRELDANPQGKKFTITKIIGNKTCELNRNAEKDSDMTTDQSIDTGGMG